MSFSCIPAWFRLIYCSQSQQFAATQPTQNLFHLSQGFANTWLVCSSLHDMILRCCFCYFAFVRSFTTVERTETREQRTKRSAMTCHNGSWRFFNGCARAIQFYVSA
jgi:hypothetical protein